eukprot:TRINITY_DN77771_c0_g1_i1.p1 TRINITY_DN77771_c0_g1~~TRINITY_DN77771_c0_g1_i1.p1  ORF type:complete len:209 (-),score=35.37 TRINITY_DN77771_c0_g1_i1:112-738(-)
MAYSAPYAAVDQEIPVWHDKPFWQIDRVYGRTKTDVTLESRDGWRSYLSHDGSAENPQAIISRHTGNRFAARTMTSKRLSAELAAAKGGAAGGLMSKTFHVGGGGSHSSSSPLASTGELRRSRSTPMTTLQASQLFMEKERGVWDNHISPARATSSATFKASRAADTLEIIKPNFKPCPKPPQSYSSDEGRMWLRSNPRHGAPSRQLA